MKKIIISIICLIFLLNITIGTSSVQAKSKSDSITELINYKIYLNDELIQMSKKKGYFYQDGEYIPAAISYKNTTYVPVTYLTNLFGFRAIENSGKIEIYDDSSESENDDEQYNYCERTEGDYDEEYDYYDSEDEYYVDEELDCEDESYVEDEDEEEYVEDEDEDYSDEDIVVSKPKSQKKDKKKDEKSKNIEFNKLDDLSLNGPYKISPLDNAGGIVKKYKTIKGSIVDKSGNTYYITDSPYTDTSYFLSIKFNKKGKIINYFYSDFNKGSKLKMVAPRDIRILKSKAKDVFKKYGKEKAKVEVNKYPDGERMAVISYKFKVKNNDKDGDISFFIDMKKDKNVEKGVVYGYEFNIN